MKAPLVVGSCVLCAALGFLAGRSLSSPVPACPEQGEVTADDSPPAAGMAARWPQTPTDAANLREELDQTRAKLALQDVLIDELSAQSHGEPVAWPADGAPAIDPDNFRSVVSEALSKDDNPLDMVTTDCAEPPCIAVLKMAAPESGSGVDQTLEATADLLGSRSWTANLGKSVSISRFEPFDCGDRGIEWVVLVAPQLPADTPGAERANVDKRVSHRATQIFDEWDCEPIAIKTLLERP